MPSPYHLQEAPQDGTTIWIQARLKCGMSW